MAPNRDPQTDPTALTAALANVGDRWDRLQTLIRTRLLVATLALPIGVLLAPRATPESWWVLWWSLLAVGVLSALYWAGTLLRRAETLQIAIQLLFDLTIVTVLAAEPERLYSAQELASRTHVSPPTAGESALSGVRLRRGRLLHREGMRDSVRTLIFQPELETMPPAERARLQGDRLHELVARLKAVDSSYWQGKLAAVDADTVTRIEDLATLPFTTKAEFREQFPFGMLAAPLERTVRVHASSGTRGKPTVVAYTRRDIEIFAEVNARSVACAGGRPEDVVHVAYGYGLFTGGLGLHYGVEALGATAVPASGGNPGFQVQLLADLGAQGLCCTPSFAMLLAERAASDKLLGQLRLRYGVLGAEPWSDSFRGKLEEAWGETAAGGFDACDIYGLSEVIGPGVAMECRESKGALFVFDDHFVPEVVDPDSGEPVAPGEFGELVLTTVTKEALPVTAFLQANQLARDLVRVNDAARGKFLSVVGMALALMKNYDPFKAPTHFKLADLMKKFDKTFGATGRNYGKVGIDRTDQDIEMRRSDRWNFLFIAGMWFQDLFNYDFRRTERCIIPYATQQGEISFCAYNTGIGWRNILEKMHMTATLTRWYEQHGRHEIFAGNKHVPLGSKAHSLVLNAEAVAAGAQTDLEELGVAKNAREEKLHARRKAQLTPDEIRHHMEMERLYRQQVLKEQPTIQIQGRGGTKKSDVQPVVHKDVV